jgi:hypothetical protein
MRIAMPSRSAIAAPGNRRRLSDLVDIDVKKIGRMNCPGSRLWGRHAARSHSFR